ncbi:hypothetical protein QEN19_002433 [Hanseniaspora menglaensis]
MSRAKEIKEKQALQAKLALAFNAKRQTVLSWLGEDKNQASEEKNIEIHKTEFFNLPVVAAGSILNFSHSFFTGSQNTIDNKTEIGTVGQFLKSEKKISSLTKKRNTNNKSGIQDQFKVQKNDNKATVAFKNKMRDSNRQQLRKKENNNIESQRTARPIDSDLDSDEDSRNKDIRKKSNNMPVQFGKKKSK